MRVVLEIKMDFDTAEEQDEEEIRHELTRAVMNAWGAGDLNVRFFRGDIINISTRFPNEG